MYRYLSISIYVVSTLVYQVCMSLFLYILVDKSTGLYSYMYCSFIASSLELSIACHLKKTGMLLVML